MKSLKIALSALGAVFLAEFILALWSMFRTLSPEKATGVAALAGGLLESLVSPWFWIIAILLFFLFFRGSKLSSSALRILLFWVPTIFSCTIGLLFVTMYAYLFFRYRQH
jgi:hypothetical protein